MSPVLQPMTYEELSQIYREEKNGKALMPCRQDLYRAFADLLTRLRQDYDREIAKDPDSIMAEGANQKRKKAETQIKFITSLRARKICNKAVLSADGNIEELNALTPEERDYYEQLVSLSKAQLTLVDGYRGKKTVNTLIDEPHRTPAPEIPVKEPEPMPEPSEAIASGVEDEFPPTSDEAELMDSAMEDEFYESEPDDIVQQPAEPEIVSAEETPVPEADTMVIRVLEDLPPFAGPDRDNEHHKEDIVTLPKAMALVLVNSQKAAAVTPSL
ncbi:MAG: DNA replication complex GINS family protein [Candidatus Methanomethylophilaceae archaeon]|nr:DNA replication complex GINS family protein [Candidatus Methanomethylophilaceae archaeon]